MKFSKYLKVTCFSLVIFLYVSNFAYAQRDLRGWHTQGQTFLVWKHSKLILLILMKYTPARSLLLRSTMLPG